MTDLLRLLLDAIAYIWPFRIVYQYQRGCYYVLGRFWREIGPGLYPVIPWFTAVNEADVVEAIITTPRQDITLKDGSMLSFAASATLRVVNVRAALNEVDQYRETAQEAVAAVLAERLSQVDTERLEPDKRNRLLADLKKWVADEITPYGIEVSKLRFTSFIVNARAYRFIVDQANTAAW
jgi:regulator of protease activity HflC (stomatin/prohibitin superfamily)